MSVFICILSHKIDRLFSFSLYLSHYLYGTHGVLWNTMKTTVHTQQSHTLTVPPASMPSLSICQTISPPCCASKPVSLPRSVSVCLSVGLSIVIVVFPFSDMLYYSSPGRPLSPACASHSVGRIRSRASVPTPLASDLSVCVCAQGAAAMLQDRLGPPAAQVQVDLDQQGSERVHGQLSAVLALRPKKCQLKPGVF